MYPISSKSIARGFAIESARGIQSGGNAFVLAVSSVLTACQDMGVSTSDRNEFIEWAHAVLAKANQDIFSMQDEAGVDPDYVKGIEAPELDELWRKL